MPESRYIAPLADILMSTLNDKFIFAISLLRGLIKYVKTRQRVCEDQAKSLIFEETTPYSEAMIRSHWNYLIENP